MNVDSLNSVFNWASVVLVGLTVIAGAGALVTGKIISMRQEKAIAAAGAEAAKANERAAAAELKTEEVRAESAGAKRDAAVANESAGKANERAAALELKAEELRRENVEIERAFSPRVFPTEYPLVQEFSRFGQVTAVVEFVHNDEECLDLAKQIVSFMRAANWDVGPPTPSQEFFFANVSVNVNSEPTETGLHSSAKTRQAIEAAKALLEELKRWNIAASQAPNLPGTPRETVVVRVGRRPNPVSRRMTREHLKKYWPPNQPLPEGF